MAALRCRNMQDLWDEEYTDLCRENFINAMYKFPDTPVTELENGREMPILGVGTWLKQNVQETIEQALRAGFRSPSQCTLYTARRISMPQAAAVAEGSQQAGQCWLLCPWQLHAWHCPFIPGML